MKNVGIYLLSIIVLLMFAACGGSDPLKADISGISVSNMSEDEYGDSERFYNPLVINFSGGAVSPAKLDLIGKTITEGIKLTPNVAGSWMWTDEYQLVFSPEHDFAPDTEYTVTLSGSIFASAYAKKDRSYKVKSPMFIVTVNDSAISRIPGEQRSVNGVFNVSFSHKVDEKSFRQSVNMMLEDKPVNFDVKFADNGYTAYVTAEKLPIAAEQKQLIFTSIGACGEGSSSNMKQPVRTTLVVPSLESVFTVSNVASLLMRDDKFEPQQIISVGFTDEVLPEAMNGKFDLFLVQRNDFDVSDYEYIRPDEGMGGYRAVPELVEQIVNKGKRLNYQAMPLASKSSDIHNFVIDVQEPSKLYVAVVVRRGLESVSGFSLAQPYVILLEIPQYPVEVYINNDGAILSPAGSEIVTISARGLNAVKVEIGALLPNQLQHVITSTYSGGFGADFKGDEVLDEENFAVFTQETIPLAARNKKETSYAAVDLSKYRNKSSFFFIRARGVDRNGNTITGTITKTIVLTDIAIIRKQNQNKASGVYLFSVSKGEPVQYAAVSVIGKNGLSVLNAYTDNNGYAELPSLSEFNRDKQPIAIVATKGNDVSFMPIDNYRRAVDFSRFDTGGTYEGSEESLRAYLTTGRGIYRPGDTVEIAGIVKQKDWRKLGGVPVEAVIYSPDGKQSLVKRFTLTDEALFDIIFNTTATMLTGTYSMELHLIKNGVQNGLLGHTTFKLDEFEPDTMRLKVKIDGKVQSGWQKPDKLGAYVKCENMFGTPAPDRKVVWSAFAVPSSFRFRDYSEYTFTDPAADARAYRQRRAEIRLADSKTDANGESVQKLDAATFPLGTYMLTLEANAFMPESGDSVSSSDSALVSPLDYIVGYKTTADLRFVRRASNQQVTFIAVNNELRQIPLNNLILGLNRIETIRTLVKGPDGAYRYMSVEKETPISAAKDMKLAAEGLETELPTNEAGRYMLVLSDNKGTVLSRISYFVSGESNVRLAVDKNAELSLALEKSAYKPGDIVHMSVIAPYEGLGLITLESDKVYAYKWFKTTSTASLQSITIPEGMEGSGYVNVSMIRDGKSQEVFMSPYSYAAVPFRLDTSARRINIDIQTPALSQPSEVMTIKYTADKDGRIILFGADEGILQVAKYTYPNPLGFFFTKMALQVMTYQTADLILPDYAVLREAARAGGGESAEMLAAPMQNPFKRRVAKSAVFWSGVKEVKAGVTYEYAYTVPETFNGNMKIMALASSESAVGTVVKDAVVRSPVVITPSSPLAVAPGDVFEIPVTLANNIENSTGQDNISVTASVSEHLELIGTPEFSEDIRKSGERTVRYKFKALEKPGGATVTFTVKSALLKKPLTNTATLSVRPAVAYVQTLNTGKFTTAKHNVKGIFRNMYDEYAVRSAGASENPMLAAVGIARYLEKYPHGCTEQLISRAFPLILLGGSGIESGASSDAVKKLIETIVTRQRANGGFVYWGEYPDDNMFVTVYAMHMLTEAKLGGISVSDAVMKRGIGRLNDMLMSDPEDEFEVRMHANAIYVLARNGIVVSRQISRLEEYLKQSPEFKWRETLAGAYIGAAYMVMLNDKKGAELMQAFKPQGNNYIFYSDFDSSSLQNAQYVYLVSLHAPSLEKQLAPLVEGILANISQGFYNTVDSAYSIMALWAYGKGKDSEVPALESVDSAGKKTVLEFAKNKQREAAFAGNTQELNITFGESKPEGYFWYVLQNGYDKALPKSSTSGIEITKEYLDKEGKVINAIGIGGEVTVRLRLRISGKHDFVSNVAVTDLLPGGFDIIRGSISVKDYEYIISDIREDRLLIYTDLVGTDMREITYRARATAAGEFTAPAAYAESMYKKDIRANSQPGKFNVTNEKK